MMEHHNLFATPVLRISCARWDEKKPTLLSLVDWDDPDYRNATHISDYHHNMQSGCSYTQSFCNLMYEELDAVLSHFHIEELQIGNLWGQRYFGADYMPAHTHGAVGLSAVLYVDFDKGSHAGTRFMSPIHNYMGVMMYHEMSVQEGDLVVFPSYLMHDAPASGSDAPRTIFSFNSRV